MKSAASLEGPSRQFVKHAVSRYYDILLRFREPYQYVFVLSHARSGSSLLTHLLVSNEEITGFGETHTQYESPLEFRLLVAKVAEKTGRFPKAPRERYILDKILYDHLLRPSHADLLDTEKVLVIFLLRDPGPTIKSLINTFSLDEEAANRYYVERLATLAALAKRLPPSTQRFALTYRQILYTTSRILAALTSFLELAKPLTEEYRLLPTTGVAGLGDMSDNIFTGRIVRPGDGSPAVPMGGVRTEAAAAYSRCLGVLTQHCQTLDSIISDPPNGVTESS